MQIKELLSNWEANYNRKINTKVLKLEVPVELAAKLKALEDLYDSLHMNDIVTELLVSSVNEIEKSLPYIEGNEVITHDEMGDPIYADVGPTPRFLELSRKYLKDIRLQQGLKPQGL